MKRAEKKLRCIIKYDNGVNSWAREKGEYYQEKYRHLLPLEVHHHDQFGRYPIHVAAENGAPLEVVQLLVERCGDQTKGGLVTKYNMENSDTLPLHAICGGGGEDTERQESTFWNAQQKETAVWMMKEYPQAIPVLQNKDLVRKVTPLHLLLERKPPFGLVKKMFELAPENTNIKRIKDGEGQLPLHTVLDYQADDEIINIL